MTPFDIIAGLLLLVPVGLIMKQPDLGTSLLVLAAGLSVIYFAGLPWRLVLPPVVLGLVGIAVLVAMGDDWCADGVRWPILHDYQQQRICTLLDPTRDPLGKGFHIIQGMIAIGSGGVFGKGFMAGTQTHLEFIPERTTDFIFAAYGEEFGLAGGLVLIAIYIFIVLRALVIALNKWDGMEQGEKDYVKTELERRLFFVDYADIHFISALHGSGVGHLFESINEAYESATRRTSTAMLTRIMQMAQEDHQPPMVNGRRVKLKYAHAGGYNPPRIVIHGNQLNDLPDSYKRYLINYFRKSLKIMGTPIRVEFQESVNPFEGKKNTLTLSQERQRKRLLKAKAKK